MTKYRQIAMLRNKRTRCGFFSPDSFFVILHGSVTASQKAAAHLETSCLSRPLLKI
jgi:hypothetical protein